MAYTFIGPFHLRPEPALSGRLAPALLRGVCCLSIFQSPHHTETGALGFHRHISLAHFQKVARLCISLAPLT